VEIGNLKLEIRNWKLESGNWKIGRQFPRIDALWGRERKEKLEIGT
jgi:hypothetical protein